MAQKIKSGKVNFNAAVFVFVFAAVGMFAITQTYAANRGKPKAEIYLSLSQVYYGDPLTASATLNKTIDAGYVTLECYKGRNQTVFFDGGFVQRGEITLLEETFESVGGSLAWPSGDAECEIKFFKYDDARYKKQLIDSVTFTVVDNR